ncbi:bifunctional 4-hydroxy-2-oxoglutarate aldolase/2-dehydro-3-deoxy-phosphogluconate aldolase [Pedobacter frigiditerrae]|uniref:Bifunctional 4-hydroxy-2-oxoglutarate aldolase/2-dehydro-3-deoxy-phosphogluconate aldolase n=1 Tax=Pedobacter frigiditerrae TaxID=2530452 RepID=A0A4R0MY59_9SPHI|nr:bifunctional 4-hydroxy-2-oxoglutarate aldolase/2-dehydro-3-deoxy-phosphogluconate aldolase [Pedobacter frigiditerrae]TCC91837.1 bifunctional 4-hydroxy-2-oxoglutarate aldolase/2-dehydro-3-deoxy-phosphogluconate aldolase [Pedobacter frigiditerrae]
MTKNKETTIAAIRTQGMLPLFYYEDAQVSLEIVRALYKGGVRVFEYTNRGKAALENFKFLKEALKTEMQDLFLGIGTIKNTTEVKEFLAAGADFIVCPVVDLEVGKLTHDAGLLWIPGCMTPTEINVAHQFGAGIIKLFPANILGPEYLSSIKELFQGQLFVPTGGVEIDETNIDNWFKAGVCAVGMGSKLVSKKILENKAYDELHALTTKAFEIINKVKP